MLRVIAESQRSVQKEFHALTDMQPQAVGSKDIVDDLQEMDKTVEQIETAVRQAIITAGSKLMPLLAISSSNRLT